MKRVNIELRLIEDYSDEDLQEFTDIFELLINKGALTGIRGGQAILHFDAEANFQGVELKYWPWRKRKNS